MERFTNIFTISQHLLASFQGMDRRGCFPRSVAAIARTLRPPKAGGLVRSIRGRHILPRKKKGADVGKTKRGKGTKLMLLVDGNGLPLALDRTSASPAEVKLIESLLDQRVLPRDPDRLIYDRVADCDPLRTRLAKRQIELICPHRKNRVKPATQDGRALRRYRRRWKVERTISWLFNFRRLVVRYERYSHLFLGFAQLAGVFTLLNKL
ncbi:Transposase DDE domain protein [Gimesia algae]|uniref:Transposase DDE domain protein n=1 Tax=Gimesia algae TaxID=2527971 RepID=A0A517VA86_9PLAN|nr:Transposase DDE domain protein [Gimesia algae]